MNHFPEAFLLTVLIFGLVLLLPTSLRAQACSGKNEPELLDKVQAEIHRYTDSFRNLTTTQTKTIRLFDRSGKTKRTRTITSDMVVVEIDGTDGVTEFFIVRTVDGKAIRDADRRSLRMFRNLAKSRDAKQSLERLRKESIRYDLGILVHGFTLSQSIAFEKDVRQAFDYRIECSTRDTANEFIKIVYEQKEIIPSLDLNIDAPKTLSISRTYIRGEALIDPSSFQIAKLLTQIVIESPHFTSPFVVVQQDAKYRPSRFGFRVPESITWETLQPIVERSVLRTGKPSSPSSIRSVLLELKYDEFDEFLIDVSSSEVGRPPQ